jgi:hypothetical protein
MVTKANKNRESPFQKQTKTKHSTGASHLKSLSDSLNIIRDVVFVSHDSDVDGIVFFVEHCLSVKPMRHLPRAQTRCRCKLVVIHSIGVHFFFVIHLQGSVAQLFGDVVYISVPPFQASTTR